MPGEAGYRFAVGSHGAVYVSNFGSSTATAAHPGEILKITGLS